MWNEAEQAFVLRGLTMLEKSLKRKSDDETLSPQMSAQYSQEMQAVQQLKMKLMTSPKEDKKRKKQEPDAPAGA